MRGRSAKDYEVFEKEEGVWGGLWEKVKKEEVIKERFWWKGCFLMLIFFEFEVFVKRKLEEGAYEVKGGG